jgi:hypothetical protein
MDRSAPAEGMTENRGTNTADSRSARRIGAVKNSSVAAEPHAGSFPHAAANSVEILLVGFGRESPNHNVPE